MAGRNGRAALLRDMLTRGTGNREPEPACLWFGEIFESKTLRGG